jgi:hypothetical protein
MTQTKGRRPMTFDVTMPYTIAIDTAADLLAACVPDGDTVALDRELADYHQQSTLGYEPTIEIISGLVLTDEYPEDEDSVVWQGHDRGWLSNVAGETFKYAVRRPAQEGWEDRIS